MHRNTSNDSYNPADDIYKETIGHVLSNGFIKDDRTGTCTTATFAEFQRYNLINGRSPRLSLKKMSDTPEREMLWFISGDTRIKALRDQNIGIWNSWLIPGTAKYRPMTEEEVKKAITAMHKTEYGASSTVFTQSPVWESGDWASQSPLGQIEKRELHYADLAALHNYYTKMSGKEPEVLIDGDIGPGGYGAQWRFWEDTQTVCQADLAAYLSQGYKQIGEITPDIQPRGVEAIKAALHDFLISEGHSDTSIGDADPAMVSECGWEAVGTVGQCAHVLYLDEAALIKAYVNILDIPRFVVHRKIDQLKNAIELLQTNPDSRRIIVSAWNPALIWKAALPPCHLYFQFVSVELTVEQRVRIFNDRTSLHKRDVYLEEVRTGFLMTTLVTWNFVNLEEMREAGKTDEEIHNHLDTLNVKRRGLNCFLLLRSNDLGLGQPFNVAQYASLTHMVAQCVEMEPLELAWAAVDAHVYSNHVDALKEQLDIPSIECIPRIRLNQNITDIDQFTINDITVIDYESHASMSSKMPVAV
jgi:thymidylate synthase